MHSLHPQRGDLRTNPGIRSTITTPHTSLFVKPILSFLSSLVQGTRDCACEALKAVKCKSLPERETFAAMRYNQRVITVNLIRGIATIASTKGRIKTTFKIPDCYQDYLTWKIKSSTISYDKRSKTFYLRVSLEHPDPELTQDIKILGIDRGIVNIAVWLR